MLYEVITVNGVQKPSKGEAIIRIGGFFANPLDGTDGMKVKKLTVNGNPVIVDADNFVANTRGYGMGNYKGSWFGVLELECPIEYLKSGQNTVYFERWQGAEYTTVMIQVFDMTAAPGRTTGGITNLAPTVNAGSDQTLAVGTTKATLIRITSYNVCYTKLLRALTVGAKLVIPPVVRPGAAVMSKT